MAPWKVRLGFEELFNDHQSLSDFLWRNAGIKEDLRFLQHEARKGNVGCNSPSTLWLRRFLSAIRAEVDELDNSIPWKWWRGEKTDIQNVRVELVDIFHFLLSAASASGMSSEDFINLYYQKRKLNFERQVKGFKKDDNRKLTT